MSPVLHHYCALPRQPTGPPSVADLSTVLVADALAAYQRLHGREATAIVAHPGTATDVWRRWTDADTIYVGRYRGWFCAACQRFYADHEVHDGPSCPTHPRSLASVDEDCWLFRLSRYGGEADIPLGAAGSPWTDPSPGARSAPLLALASSWPDGGATTTCVVPDELAWYATVAWPAMLTAAGRHAPAGVVVLATPGRDEGRRPERWLTLPPDTLARELGADALRYLVLRWPDIAPGGVLSADALLDAYTSELTNGLGNLVARTTAMAAELGGRIARPEAPESPFVAELERCGAPEAQDPERLLAAIERLVRAGNSFMERRQPWKQAPADRARTLWHALELCRVVGHLVGPVLPDRSPAILGRLGVSEAPHWPVWGGVQADFEVETGGEPLFPAISGPRRKRLLRAWEEEAEKISPWVEITAEDFGRLDLRVARIAGAERVTTTGGCLLKVELDLGGERQTVFSTALTRAGRPESLVGRMVVYLSNFQQVEIAGFESKGMVLTVPGPDATAVLAFDREHEPGTVMF
jgi:methionyl-tRNA synthetase